MKNYDLIIIGAGGGTKLRPVTELGKKIAVLEREAPGGTCLNRGCIPSKMLIHTADIAEELREAHKFDLKVDTNFAVDFSTLTKRITNHVAASSNKITEFYQSHPQIDYYPHEGKFLDDKTILVNGEKITAEKIFIAVGARPHIPSIPGLQGTPYMTSTEALRADKQPRKMIVIGGGYIATELGYFYAALGTEVHFVVRSSMLKGEDFEVTEEFFKVFSEKHPIHLGYSPTSVSYNSNNFQVEISDNKNNKKTLEADALLITTGITPNTDTLNLESTKIKADDRGYIIVDDYLQTSVKDVYALGDCVGNYFFRHSVNFEGEYLLRTLYTHPSDEPIEYSPMPHAVFSNPQIAGVGLTEDELMAQGLKRDKDYIVGKTPYSQSAMGGDALQAEHGFVKLLFDRNTKKLLGGHIIGKEASDMVHMLIAYINMNATLDDLLRTIYIHPALPEIIRNAARNAEENFKKS